MIEFNRQNDLYQLMHAGLVATTSGGLITLCGAFSRIFIFVTHFVGSVHGLPVFNHRNYQREICR